MKVAQVVPSLSRLGGGMFESVRHLSRNIHALRLGDIEVIGLSDEMTGNDIAAWAPVRAQAHCVRGPRSFGYAPTVGEALRVGEFDIVHLHGLWKYLSIAVSRWARRTSRPYVISPRGMLEPWALTQSPIRKKIALAAFQRSALERAACLHATSNQEAQNIRNLGFHNPIVVIPNGVMLPEIRRRSNRNHQTRSALFLSRLHPKKGLLNLLTAWHAVRPSGWRLRIAGPDEKNHLQKAEAVTRDLSLENYVTFLGDVRSNAKADAYESADLFILPSYSENFGLVIAEALSFGIPTITTRATPWADLETYGCGWWIDPGVEPLVLALREATSLPPGELQQMGLRGRSLIEQKYSWDKAARQMQEVYDWVTGTVSRPASIV